MTDFYNLVPSAPEGRFDGIERPYSPDDVKRLRGSVQIRHTLAEMGANRLWKLIHEEDFVNALGALSRQPGDADGPRRAEGDLPLRLAGRGRRQHRLAPCIPTSRSIRPMPAPELAKRINRTLQRADQIETSEGKGCRSTPGSRRSSPMPRPASAGRSTPSRS